MTLHGYWRSTTSYRVRIALNLKGRAYDVVPVNLVAGDQHGPDYARLNPGRSVPTLVTDDGTVLVQSMAILEWLEEVYPDPPLLPEGAAARAQVRAAAMTVASDIHPVNNLRILARLKEMGHGPDEIRDWMIEWMSRGFAAISALIRPDTPFCFGDTAGLADVCLIPQLYNARRWEMDLGPFARLTEIEAQCLALPAFDTARPETQADAA